jgi:ferritin-like metal-binding protein YciE
LEAATPLDRPFLVVPLLLSLREEKVMKLASLEDLYIDNLQDVYDAEHQITDALPKMIKAASSSSLQNGFEKHLQQTKEQIKRLEAVFENHTATAKRKTCKGMKGLIAEGDEMIKENATADVLDAALIGAAQKVEHYEIAAYGTLRTYADLLGFQNDVRYLDATLQEEGATDKELTRLAGMINVRAENA